MPVDHLTHGARNVETTATRAALRPAPTPHAGQTELEIAALESQVLGLDELLRRLHPH